MATKKKRPPCDQARGTVTIKFDLAAGVIVNSIDFAPLSVVPYSQFVTFWFSGLSFLPGYVCTCCSIILGTAVGGPNLINTFGTLIHVPDHWLPRPTNTQCYNLGLQLMEMGRAGEAERFAGKALGLVKLGSSQAFAARWEETIYQVQAHSLTLACCLKWLARLMAGNKSQSQSQSQSTRLKLLHTVALCTY